MAGLENAQECYCGNALQNYGAPGYTGCTMACKGNKYEICGGADRLSVFWSTTYVLPSNPQVVDNYVYEGCYHEAAVGRLLPGPSYTNSTGMTVESCVDFCRAESPSLTYAGVEYAQECYCATTLASTATSVPNSQCSMLCKGNDKEYCGAGLLLNVYNYNPSAAATMTSAPVATNSAP
jgi:WSC domain